MGGNVGAKPRIANELVTGLDDDQAMEWADKIISCYREQENKGERLGRMIDRIGFDTLKAALL